VRVRVRVKVRVHKVVASREGMTDATEYGEREIQRNLERERYNGLTSVSTILHQILQNRPPWLASIFAPLPPFVE
jgi:hypothetical protein